MPSFLRMSAGIVVRQREVTFECALTMGTTLTKFASASTARPCFAGPSPDYPSNHAPHDRRSAGRGGDGARAQLRANLEARIRIRRGRSRERGCGNRGPSIQVVILSAAREQLGFNPIRPPV
jgi:hypothetical protein